MYFAPERLIGAVSDTKTPQGAVSRCFLCRCFLKRRAKKILALDAVHGIRAMWVRFGARRTQRDFRRCIWARAAQILIRPRCNAQPWAAPFRVPVKMGGLAGMLAALKKRGVPGGWPARWTAWILPRAPALGRRLVIVIGNEARGRFPRSARAGGCKVAAADARRGGVPQRGGGGGNFDVCVDCAGGGKVSARGRTRFWSVP